MGERYTIYLKEDEEELQKFIEEYNDVVGGNSRLFKMALKHMRNEKRAALEELKATESFDEIT